MKKVLLAVGIILAVLLVGILLLLWYVSSRPAAPADYQETTQTGGSVEETYLASGPWEVSHFEQPVFQGFSKYLVYYPSETAEGDGAYPVIVLCNGSGTPLSKYTAVAEHFASWGFLVIGTEEEYDWNGFAAEMCIRYLHLLQESETVNEKENPLYQKIDLDRVGVIGHSQGGVGVINAITAQRHSSIFKAAVSLSPTNKEMAQALQWDYDVSQVSTPILLVSGAGGGDDWVVTGQQLEEIYGDIGGPKAMLRRKDTAHNQVLYAANGYVTAWFRYWLQDDGAAGKAFLGDAPKIMENNLYQDQRLCLDAEG